MRLRDSTLLAELWQDWCRHTFTGKKSVPKWVLVPVSLLNGKSQKVKYYHAALYRRTQMVVTTHAAVQCFYYLFIMQQTAALAINPKAAKKSWLYACVPTTINTYCEFMSPFTLSYKHSSSFPTCKWAVGWLKHPTWRDVVYCRKNPGHREAMMKGPDTSHHVLNMDLHTTLFLPNSLMSSFISFCSVTSPCFSHSKGIVMISSTWCLLGVRRQNKALWTYLTYSRREVREEDETSASLLGIAADCGGSWGLRPPKSWLNHISPQT